MPRDASLRSCGVPRTMDPMRTSAWKAVLGSVLVGMSLGACGGGSFTSSGSEADASTGDAGAGGQAGGSGGTGGSATGGVAGAQGGSGGTAQTGGTGASETGGTGGTQTGGTGGTGTTCPGFDHCQPSSAPAPACGICAKYVCEDLPHCCDDIWDWMCVLEAQTLGECQCKGLVCTPPTFPMPSAGACVPDSSFCNPLIPGGPCGQQQCAVNADLGQLKYQCAPIGEVPACDPCNSTMGKSCGLGFSCVAGMCVRPCCSAQDCGPEGECAPSLLPGSNDGLGICRRS